MRTEKPASGRRTLGTLQPSANNQSVLVGSAGKVAIDKKKVDTKKRRLNFDLENNPREVNDEKTKKEREFEVRVESEKVVISKEDYDMMLRDEASIEYWKQLAEERRTALEKALQENEKLYEDIGILEAENKHLQKMADHCVELANIVKTLSQDEDDSQE